MNSVDVCPSVGVLHFGLIVAVRDGEVCVLRLGLAGSL